MSTAVGREVENEVPGAEEEMERCPVPCTAPPQVHRNWPWLPV